MNGLQHLFAILAFFAAFCMALIVGGIGVAHKFGLVTYDMTMMVLNDYGILVPAAAAGLAGLTILLGLIRRKGAGVMTAIFALCFAAAAAYVPYTMKAKAEALPRLTDVSTDTADAPVYVALADQHVQMGQRLDYDVTTAAAQKSGYPDIKTVTRSDSSAALYAKALAAVKALGWLVWAEEATEGRIEAQVVSEWFGFKEDVVIRVVADGNGSRLDIRSASRQGKIDYGANADNIRAFFAKLK